MNAENKAMICQLEVCDDICVTAQHFRDDIVVHIRKYEQGPNGQKIPTKRGATIPIHRLDAFTELFAETDQAIKQFKADKTFSFRSEFGGQWWLSLDKFPLINIRKWFRPANGDDLLPTKTGISLTFYQWLRVKDAVLLMKKDFFTENNEVVRCGDGKELWNCSKCLCADCF